MRGASRIRKKSWDEEEEEVISDLKSHDNEQPLGQIACGDQSDTRSDPVIYILYRRH